MNTYIRMINQINTAIKYIVSTMLVFLTILVVLQVTTRFVINVPLAWTEEIAKYLMIYIVFFGFRTSNAKQSTYRYRFYGRDIEGKKQSIVRKNYPLDMRYFQCVPYLLRKSTYL